MSSDLVDVLSTHALLADKGSGICGKGSLVVRLKLGGTLMTLLQEVRDGVHLPVRVASLCPALVRNQIITSGWSVHARHRQNLICHFDIRRILGLEQLAV